MNVDMQAMTNHITIKGARLHNLKNITLSIPKNKLVVFTGLSGSGKSTLAFDMLHKEGQRQYMESLGLVTDALSKSQVDAIEGLSPSICVDQHLTNRSPRSTVGTGRLRCSRICACSTRGAATALARLAAWTSRRLTT